MDNPVFLIVMGILVLITALIIFSFSRKNEPRSSKGHKKAAAPPEDDSFDTAAEIATQLNYDHEIIENASSAEITSRYQTLLEEGKKEGFTPLIVIPTDVMAEILFETYPDDESFIDDILKEAQEIDAVSVLQERFNYSAPIEDDDFDYKGEFIPSQPPSEFISLLDYDTGLTYKKLLIFKLPTANPWEAAAFFPVGGFNECPSPEEQVAIFKYWYEKHGAFPAVVGHDTWELFVEKPVANEEGATSLAYEQFSFCSDLVYQGVGSLGALAGGLVNSTFWYFWWD